jgi:hypothetical protein
MPGDDQDKDGYTIEQGDCDDTNKEVYPFAGDTFGDQVDSDCDNLDCSAGYVENTYFVICPAEVTQAQGNDECKKAGYDGLATVVSATDHNGIVKLIASMTHDYWLGLNDKATEGQWTWESGQNVSYTKWRPGEPDNNSDADCVLMDSRFDWNWSDKPCSQSIQTCASGCPSDWVDRPYGYVCEKR